MSTILITGANRGLGFLTAKALAAQDHRIMMAVRDEAVGSAATARILQQQPDAKLEVLQVDLSVIPSIQKLAEQLQDEPIDVLYHNAGILVPPRERQLTAAGYERTLMVNALAPMLLTHLLAPSLFRAAEARVVCVSSRLHFPDSRGKPVDFNFADPHLLQGYHPERAYKNSKLALLWFTFELARRWQAEGIAVNAICPGFVPKTAAENISGFQRFMLKYILSHFSFAVSPQQATQHLVDMASHTASSGQFWADGKVIHASEDARNPELAQRFWAWASHSLGIATYA